MATATMRFSYAKLSNVQRFLRLLYWKRMISGCQAYGKRVSTGLRLRLARHHCGWSQDELAQRAGIRAATISAIERDLSPGRRVMRRLAQALEVEPGWLLMGSDPPDWAPDSTTGVIRRLAEAPEGGYRADPGGTWRLLGSIGPGGAYQSGGGSVGPPASAVALRCADPAALLGLPAPGLLLVDAKRTPRHGEICLYWSTEDRVQLVRYLSEDGESGFVLVGVGGNGGSGEALMVSFARGERPLRLHPLMGVVATP